MLIEQTAQARLGGRKVPSGDERLTLMEQKVRGHPFVTGDLLGAVIQLRSVRKPLALHRNRRKVIQGVRREPGVFAAQGNDKPERLDGFLVTVERNQSLPPLENRLQALRTFLERFEQAIEIAECLGELALPLLGEPHFEERIVGQRNVETVA